MNPYKFKRLKKILLELIDSVEYEDKKVKEWMVEKFIDNNLKEFLK